MHAKTKGTILNITLGHTRFYFFLCILTCMAMIVSYAHAQGQTSDNSKKPKLAEIVLNSETNDPSALEVAKKLNPEFFIVDTESFPETPNFYAQYLPLDPKKPNRFLSVTVTGTLYYCTNHGCPYYIYENKGDNKWGLVLSLQTHGIYYDLNRTENKPSNLISVGNVQANRKIRIWMWNGLRYEEVSNK